MSDLIEGVEGIIFELDSVLFDKSDWVLPATEFAAQQMRLDPNKAVTVANEYIVTHGGADPQIYNAILLGCGQFDTAMNIRAFTSLVNQFQPASRSISLYPGVEEALQLLRDTYRLAIVTDGPPDTQKQKVIALGLHELIPIVIFSDEIDGIKSRLPDQRPLLAGIRALRLDAPRVMFVGHNPVKHFQRTREMGLLTVRVVSGEYGRVDYPSEDHRADFDLPSVAGLVHLLPRPQAAVAAADPGGEDATGWGVEQSWKTMSSTTEEAPSAANMPEGTRFEDAAFAALFEMTNLSTAIGNTEVEPQFASQAELETTIHTADEVLPLLGSADSASPDSSTAEPEAETETTLAGQPASRQDEEETSGDPGERMDDEFGEAQHELPESAEPQIEPQEASFDSDAVPVLLAVEQQGHQEEATSAIEPFTQPLSEATEKTGEEDSEDDDSGVLDFSTL